MVELGDSLRIFVEGIEICLQYFVVVAFFVRSIVAAFKSVGVESVDMSRSSSGPCHLKAVKSYESTVFPCCYLSCPGTAFSPLAAQFLSVFIVHMHSAVIVEGVGVVGQRQEVQIGHL